MENTDTRIQVTKAIFHKAMLELLEEKAIGFVTVKELCERAGLNRGTYYLHYSEPMDVLREMEGDVWNCITEFYNDSMTEGLLESLESVTENRRLVSVVIGHNGNPDFLKSVRDAAFQRAEAQILQNYPHTTAFEARRAFDFVFSGCTGLVTSWLKEEKTEPVEQFAKRLSCFRESVFNTLRA